MSDFDLAVDLAIEMCDHGGPTVCINCSRRGKRLVPVVRRYADAQGAEVRERIAAAIEAIVPIARRDMRPVDAKIQAHAEAARIARGQP